MVIDLIENYTSYKLRRNVVLVMFDTVTVWFEACLQRKQRENREYYNKKEEEHHVKCLDGLSKFLRTIMK